MADLRTLPVAEEKLVRMLLDIQNTAILQIKSCSKYCFSADGVQEIEKEIEDLREKFRGSGDGGHLPYFERFLSNNEKKSNGTTTLPPLTL